MDDDLRAALDALVAAAPDAGSARDEAAAIAAVVSRNSPGAAAAWGELFGRPPSAFDDAARAGQEYVRNATPALARARTGGGDATTYAHALAQFAISAASLGELTISALGTATVVGNAQLLGAGVQPPGLPLLSSPSSAAPSTEARAAAATAEAPPAKQEPQPLTLDELLAELDALVGLDAVKSEIRRQTQVLRIQKLRNAAGLKTPEMTRHLVFVGNPGTGKTTVARLVSGIYRAIGVLPKGHLVECDRSSLVAGYLGQTAIKTSEMIDKALGGALFIDEAYALASDQYGNEAIDTLVKAMEDHREELLVIVAGYPGPMQDFIHANPGLESRFRLTLTFDDYSDDQLVEIFTRLAEASDFTPTSDTITALRAILSVAPRGEGFGNGRFVRTLFESAVVRQAWRLRDVTSPNVDQLKQLEPADLSDQPAPPIEKTAPDPQKQ